jgi:hypothetical protein
LTHQNAENYLRVFPNFGNCVLPKAYEELSLLRSRARLSFHR